MHDGQLNQFRVFRALGLSIKAWFRNIVPFSILTAVLYAPAFLWIATYDLTSWETPDELADAVVHPIYLLAALSTLVAPMLTYRVINDLNGVRVSMMTSMKHGVRGIVPAIILAVVTNVLQLIPGGGIVGAILTCVWFVASPAAVAERLGPFAALSRSSFLTKGRRWGIFGLTFLLGLLVVALMLVWLVPIINDAGESADFAGRLRTAMYGCVLVIGVFNMFVGIVEATSYALLRLDKEGVSHEELARVFE